MVKTVAIPEFQGGGRLISLPLKEKDKDLH